MEIKTAGGFVFGIQGWEYGEVRPRSITFFVDGTTRVSDHHGNAIQEYIGPHKEVIAKLEDNGVDWQKLESAGWPQVPYAQLKELVKVPETPVDELAKIRNKEIRQDAVRFRKEVDAAMLAAAEVS